jgi:urea-proton symporter
LIGAQIQGGKITVDTLGTNEVMLSGNLVAILSSGFIHWFWSVFVDKTDYDFAELDKNIRLVENDLSGLTENDLNPEELDKVYRWITRRGYFISFILIFVWPVLSIPAGKFTESYFAFWVLVSIAWGFAGGIVVTVLPITESFDEIGDVFVGMYHAARGKPIVSTPGEVVSTKEIDEKPSAKPVANASPLEEEIDA